MVERGIGHLKGRFRCLHFLDACTPNKAKKIIATCCFLHNFAIKHKDVTKEEFEDDNDGRDTLSQDEIDAMFGIDDMGVDKRHAIMRSLSE